MLLATGYDDGAAHSASYCPSDPPIFTRFENIWSPTIAAESDGVEKHVFVRRAQEALSVARVRGNGYVWKQGLQAMAYGGGRCYQTGLDRPTEEVG